MADITNKLKKIINNLEKNIKNEEDLKYTKEQITSIFMLLFDEIENLKEIYDIKMDGLLQSQAINNSKLSKIEKVVNEIEKDIYLDDKEDLDITCPYCNNEFFIDIDELNSEIKCPECDNIIELSWNEENECGCSNECCKHKNIDLQNDEDEDM